MYVVAPFITYKRVVCQVFGGLLAFIALLYRFGYIWLESNSLALWALAEQLLIAHRLHPLEGQCVAVGEYLRHLLYSIATALESEA